MSKIRGVTIEFSADASKLETSLKGINSQTRDTQKQLRDVNKLLRFEPKNVEMLTQKQSVLTKRISESNDKLKTLKELQADMDAKGIDKNSEQYQALRREIVDTESLLKTFKGQLSEVDKAIFNNTDKLKLLGDELNKAGDHLKKTGDKMQDIGKSMSLKLTAPIVATGGAVSKLGMDFEFAMSEVQALTGATGSDFKKLEGAAREMGAKTSKSSKEAAEALKYMALAGWDVDTSVQGLEPILRLSEAANMDLAKASDLVTDSMAGLGIEVQDLESYLDKVIVAQSESNTSADQLMEAYVRAAGNFKDFNVATEESAAMLGVLANRGKKGSEAGTAMNSIMTNLTGSTKTSAKALEQLGVEAYDSEGKFRGVEAVLFDVMNATKGMDEEQKNTLLTMLVGRNHLSTFKLLLEGLGDEYGELKDSIENSSGALSTQAKIMMDNNHGSMEALKSAMQELGLQIYDQLKPALAELIGKAQELVDKFINLDDSTKELIIKIAGIVAAAGPLLLVGGKLVSGTGTLLKLGGSFFSSIAGGIKTLGGLTSTLGGVGSAGAAAGGAKGIGALAAGFGKTLAVSAPWIAALGAAGYGAYKLGKTALESSLDVELFGDGVSSTTEKVLGGWLELEQETIASLDRLSINQVAITKEMATEMIESHNQMKEQIDASYEEQYQSTEQILRDMYSNNKQITEGELQDMITMSQQALRDQQDDLENANEAIKSIYEKASLEKRALTKAETEEIKKHQNTMKEHAVTALTESEAEQKVIMQRIKDSSSELSAQTAAEVVKQSADQRDKTIEQAEEEYNERIRLAEQIRARGGAEAEKTANKIIEEAKKQRDGSVQEAKSMHNDVVTAAQKQATEHVDKVNWETGEVLNKWQVFKNNTSRTFNEITGNMKNAWSDGLNNTKTAWTNIKDGVSKSISDAHTSVSEKTGQIKNKISTAWSEALTTTSSKWGDIKTSIVDSVKGAWTGMGGWLSKLKGAFDFEWKLPQPKLPKISVEKKTGVLGVPYPSFSVSWNRLGGIFKQPTILPTMAGLQGVGEPSTGGEAIMPLNKLPALMADAMDKSKALNQQPVIQNIFVVDGKQIAHEVAPTVDKELQRRQLRTARQGGY